MPTNFFNLQQLDDNFRKGIIRDKYDEPTYLTFSLDFDLDKPLFDQRLLLNSSPLFNTEEGKSQSAVNYLMNRGFPDKANQLVVFLNILKYLRDSTPWYFQSVSGLDKMWEQATSGKGLKSDGIELEVNTLEAVDLRVSELADLYRNSIYDKQYMRERVPDNLRWFSMDLYVAEFRNLRNTIPLGINLSSQVNVNVGTLGGVMNTVQNVGQALGAGGDTGNKFTGSLLENYGYIKFKCRQCEFDFTKSFSGGNKLSVGKDGGRMAENSFKIKIGYFEEENQYASGSRTIDDFTKSSMVGDKWGNKKLGASIDSIGSFLSGLPVVGNKVGSMMGKAADEIQSVLNTPNALLNQASSELQQIVEQGNLGQVNPYGYPTNDDIIPPNTATPK